MRLASPRPRAATVALDVGVAAAVAAAAALWDSRFHVVPTAAGAWRGIYDAPGPLRIVLAVAFGALTAATLARAAPRSRAPLLALLAAVAPLVPVFTGRLLPLLAFQGPVLVLVLAAALAVAVVRQAREWPGERARLPAGLLLLAAFVFNGFLTTRLPGPAGAQGDEPQYLAAAHSLLTDGDLDLADEFRDGEYAAFFSGPLEPHVSVNSPAGRVYSFHAPGLAAVILPAYAIGGYAAVKLFLCAIAAVTALLVHRLVRESLRDETLAAAVWAALVFTPPLPFYAMRVYPEPVAGLATAVLLSAACGQPSAARLLAAGLAAGALPWLHSKFLPLAALGLAFAVVRPGRWRPRVAAALVFVVSVTSLLLTFAAMYGRATPMAAFGPPDLQLGRIPRGLLALLVDRQTGFFVSAPLWALALPGAALLFRRRPGDALRALCLAALPLLAASAFTGWWGGAAPPARYAVAVLPAVALVAAPAFRVRPAAAAALFGLGLGLVGLAAEAPRLLHNRADGESLLLRYLSPAVDLNAFLPSFFEPGWRPVALGLTLLAAALLAWALGWRGLAAGAAALLLVVTAVGERPLVDPRVAARDLLWDWDPGRWRGPEGPPRLGELRLPVELPREPWRIKAGELRNSRRLDLPPGAYALRLSWQPDASEGGRVRVDVHAGGVSLASGELDPAHRQESLALFLPVGARRLGLTAAGTGGAGVLSEAVLLPGDLVPAPERAFLSWPVFADGDRYRVPTGPVFVTVLDRSASEGAGFRLDGAEGRFVLDGPADAVAELFVARPRPAPGDVVVWAGQTTRLGPAVQAVVALPLARGRSLGDARVGELRVQAKNAWVRFTAGSGP